jgi:hypothetical protein
MHLGGASEKDIEELDEGNDLYDPGLYVPTPFWLSPVKHLKRFLIFLLSALSSVAVMRVLPQASCRT